MLKTKKLNAYKVQSQSDKNKWYHVLIARRGRGYSCECDCLDHIFRRRKCKHIKKAIWCFESGF